MGASSQVVVEFPTLGILIDDWVYHHCPIPDGFDKGKPFEMYPWQLEATANHYRIKKTAKFGDLAPAFHNRRSQIIGPQKLGKGPWAAAIVSVEAVGPALFAGWAGKGDGYACSDHGCGCGYEFHYEPGEPMGRPWATPLIQLVATAEDQVDNVYRPLQSMAKNGPLGDLMRTGEEFIRLPNDGKIETVTASARARLGNPITFALQDETGLYTKQNKMVSVAETQRRGAAGMGGRVIETSNAWDPTQDSVAQRTAEAATKRRDIYRYHRIPPEKLKYTVKADRAKIHRFVYAGAPHVDLRAIENEAAELLLVDEAQAERFYGNRITAGSAKWTTPEEWDAKKAKPAKVVKKRETITLGFDGSYGTSNTKRVADASVLRGCRVSDGHRFTIGIWEHERDSAGDPLEEWYVPVGEVMEKIRWAFSFYDVTLAGFDPPYWRSEIDQLIEEFGEDRVIEFRTANDQLMSSALERLKKTTTTHDDDPVVRQHALNAIAHVKEYRDDNDDRKRLVLVSKESKDSPDKIDGLISDAIAHDLRDRAIASGTRKRKKYKSVGF